MIGYIARRLLAGLVLLVVISLLTYLLLSVPNGDVARSILGPNATDDLVAAKRLELGLDRPLLSQYWSWLTEAVRGDLGRSWFTSENVRSSLAVRFPATLSLMVGATVVTAVVSFAVGVWAAVRRGVVDRLLQVFAVLGYAMPGFLVTILIVWAFAVNLGWFPAIGYTPVTESFGGWLRTITLPVVALSVGSVAGTAQQVRSSVIEVLREDYVRTLRARGLPMRRILVRHVLRNASAPALTVLGMQFVGLLGGAVLVEQIFGINGLGAMSVKYTTRGDVPVIMGLLMVTVIAVVIVNLAVDVGVGLLNPKARAS